jgi:serine/alanine adding enzyme
MESVKQEPKIYSLLSEKKTTERYYKVINDHRKVDLNELEKFVIKQQTGNFFQSRPYLEFYKSLKGHEPLLVCAYNQDNQMVGSVICIVNRLLPRLGFRFLTRAIVMGGPVVSDELENKHEVMDILIGELIAASKRKSVYLEFRNLFDISEYNHIFTKYNLNFNDHLNFIIDTSDRETVLKKMAKSKHHQIRKSLTAGCEISVATDISELKEFYPILVDLYKNKVKKPLPKREFFEAFFNQRENLGFYILIKLEGKVIGGMMCPVFANRIIYDWYVCGMDRVFKDIYPSTLVTWAAIDYAMKNNIPCYDFLGAGKPKQEYGVREFKAQFGGDLKNFGRYARILNQSQYNFSQTLLKKLGYFK